MVEGAAFFVTKEKAMKKMMCAAAMICGAGVLMVGCDGGAGTTTAPSPTGQAIKQDLQKVGQDLKADAQAAASQAGPEWEKAKQETRDALHQAAEKVAAETATRPAPAAPQ
jgi:hypothetical protein